MKVEVIPMASTPSVQISGTVLDAVRAMTESDVGATAVLEGERLVGIFSERDLMHRVVLAGRLAEQTPISEVLTEELETVCRETECSQALEMMLSRRIRHLPVLGDDGTRKLVQYLLKTQILTHLNVSDNQVKLPI